MLVDAHLDLAMNALRHERDLRQPVTMIREREAGVDDGRGTATTSLHDMRECGVMLVISTVLARCKPWVQPARRPDRTDIDYPDPTMAYAAAQGEVAWYRVMEAEGQIRVIRSREDLEAHRAVWQPGGPVGLVLMLEGADPIVEPGQMEAWHRDGVRVLSLAHYGHSRYACGTPAMSPDSPEQDGPLRPGARELLERMEQLGVVLDVTHTADTSLSQALDAFGGPLCATHCNARALCDTPRQLTDDHLRAVIARDGVIGVVTHYGMIQQGKAAKEVTLDDLADHIAYICDLAGSDRHVGIGSDMDGGFGNEKTPAGLETYADLLKLGDVLSARGWDDAAISRFLAGNWLDLLQRTLPSAAAR